MGVLAAGEYLAQPVLGKIFSVLQTFYPGADVEYFTKHLELETEHVKEITTTIAREVDNEHELVETFNGFKYGLFVWGSYFDRLTEFIAEKQLAR